jgi:hypothetical protein
VGVLADAWTAVGGFAVVAAAVAALVTIYYARATVAEARLARKESRAAHAEEVAEQRAATEAAVAAQQRAIDAATVAHREQMQKQQRAHENDIALQRVIQIGRVVTALGAVLDTAVYEWFNEQPMVSLQFRFTAIPSRLNRLRIAVAMLEALGGPELNETDALSKRGYSLGEPPSRVFNDAFNALSEIEQTIRAHESLRLS